MIVALLAALLAGPLPRAHSHNDYQHDRPLFDALERGFCSVEADIWLSSNGDALLVAHTPFGLEPDRTLQKLYLDPLRHRVKLNHGKVHADAPFFFLLIDVKTDAKNTAAKLLTVLEDYSDILTVTRDGRTTPGAVTVVVSGNCDRDSIINSKVRYASIDGRPSDLNSDSAAIPWISASWSSQFKWNGTGPMPEAERAKLKTFVAAAHKHGRKVRFWAAPEKPEVWRELLDADVDLINSDALAELQEFLLKHDRK